MKRAGLTAAVMALALLAAPGGTRVARANPAKVWVINANVASAIAATPVTPSAFLTAMQSGHATRAAYLAQLDAFQAASAGQVAETNVAVPYAGQALIVVQTDGSGTNVTLNGRGLRCVGGLTISGNTVASPTVISTAFPHGLAVGDQITIIGSNSTPPLNGTWTVATVPAATVLTLAGGPAVMVPGTAGIINAGGAACDAVATSVPDTVDHIAVFTVESAGLHKIADTLVATAMQDAITLDSNIITVVGQAQDAVLTMVNGYTTIEAPAPSCAIGNSITDSTRAGALFTYLDPMGTPLVGYSAAWSASPPSVVSIALLATVSMAQPAGAGVAAQDVVCGATPGAVTLVATASAGQIESIAGALQRTQALTVVAIQDSDGDGYTDVQEERLGKNPYVYCAIMRADVNDDGWVNIIDMALIGKAFGTTVPPTAARLDQNGNSLIEIIDMATVGKQFGKDVAACP